MAAAPKKRPPAGGGTATLSGQLRAIIRARGMTPYAAAVAAGVAPSVLTRFMSGERGLTTDTLDRLAGALGLKLVESRRGRAAPARPGPRVERTV